MRRLLLALGLVLVSAGSTWATPPVGGPFTRVVFGTGSGPTISSGTGSPEGVVAAAVGSVYLRTDGSTGSSVYFKETGSGNTGWATGGLGGGGGASHNLLSATHSDTSTAAATRACAIIVNSSSQWARVCPSVTGQTLVYDGSDTGFSSNGQALSFTASNMVGTIAGANFPALTGDVTTSAGSLATAIATGAVTSAKILDGTILFADQSLNSCTAGQFAHINAGGTAWECANPSAASAHTLLSSTHTDTNAASGVKGDIIYADASGIWTRLARGSNGDVLTLASQIPSWSASVATATALAANGSNCSAGQFPLGVDASGASESCTALPTSISGTSNEIAASASTGAVTLSLPTTVNLTSHTFRVPNSTSLPGTCTVGDSYMDTDATSGQRWYLCESTNTWAVEGGSGGGTNYQTVQDEASDLTQRAKVNFTGAGVTCADNSGASRTDCTIPGTGSGTGLVLLESHTASSSASLDFTTRNASGQSGNTFQSDYDDYQIQFVGIQPASNNVSFGYRFSSNSGSSYDSTNNYYSAATGVANGGSGASFGAASNPTTGGLLGAALSNSSSRTFEGTIYFRSVGSTTLDKSAYGTVYYTNQSNIVSLTFMGGFTVPGTAYNAIQFYMSSGNIAIGTIRIYGVTK